MSFDYDDMSLSEEDMYYINTGGHYNICKKCDKHLFCNLNKGIALESRNWFCKKCYDGLPEVEKYDNLEWEIKPWNSQKP